MLSQRRRDIPDGEYVVAYSSRHLSERESKWSTVEKEALAIVHAINVFYPYLHGRHFTVVSDHSPLQWLMRKKKPTGRLMRWSLLLQEFDFEVQYRPGSKNGNADGLSRTPLPPEGTPLVDNDEEDKVQISLIVSDWIEAQEKDSYCKAARESIDSPEIKSGLAARLEDDKVVILDNGLLAYSNGKILVPKEKRMEVMERYHAHPLAAHLGAPKVLHRIRQHFTWPGMRKDIFSFCKSFLLCAKRKAHGRIKMPLQPMPVANYIWERMALDIVGPLPESRAGNKYILVMGDYNSRYCEAVPLGDQTAPSIAKAFIKTIILRHGLPSITLSDQGSNFIGDLMTRIYEELGIKQTRTAAYSPQTNGFVEKMNRLIVDMLTMYSHNNPESWCEYLPYAIFAYNTSLQASIKETPFFVMYGRDPIEPSDLKPPSRYRLGDDELEDFTWNWHRTVELCREHLAKAQKYQKDYYDKSAKPIEFEIGDSVLLKENRTQTGKLYFRYSGPFAIIKKISPKNYVIREQGATHEFVVRTDRLKKFLPRISESVKSSESTRASESEQSNEPINDNESEPMENTESGENNEQRENPTNRCSDQELPVGTAVPAAPKKRGRPARNQMAPPMHRVVGKRPVRLPQRLRDPSILLKY